MTDSFKFSRHATLVAFALFASIFLFFVSLPQAHAAAPTNGLVGYWNFDEGSGTTAGDTSGSGNNGTLTNGPTWTAGKVGNGAVSFDGSNDYINLSSLSSTNKTYTIAFWVNRSNDQYIFDSYNGRLVIDAGMWASANNLSFYDGASWRSLGVIPSGSWHHVALVLDNGVGVSTGYVDGVQTGTGTYTGVNINSPTILGSNYLGNSNFYSGLIDDFRLYNRVLTTQEISDVYSDMGSAGSPPPAPPPGPDTTPPTISSVTASAITTSTATITWTTNESSDSQTDYGLTSSYSSQTTLYTSFVTSHSQDLANLTPGTTYHYQVKSRDVAGNLALSSDNIFTTASVTPPPPSPPPSGGSIPSTLGWYQIPNTNLRSVCPPNGFGGSGYTFYDKCWTVTEAWNSAVLDTSRNRLVVWGGGHTDYSGNEIYALDLNTLTVSRLTNPGLPLATACPEAIVNGTQPNSRHTYDGIAYMANVDKMFVFGGSKTNCGWGSQGTWVFDFTTNQWEIKNPTGPIPRADLGIVSAYDSNTGKVFIHDSLDLYTYTYSSNTYQKLTNNGVGIDYHMTGIIDPVKKKFVILGGTQAWIYDISGSVFNKQTLTTTSGSAIINSSYPGLAYDPVSGRIIGWNGGDTVYSLNLDNNIWTPVTYSGGPGAAPVNGTFKRWSYSPILGAFVSVNFMNQNAFTLRLSAAGSTPPPVPPPTPTSPPPTPTPPPATPPPPSPPSPPPSGSQITSFQLTSGTNGTLPFTVGLGFKKGDIPGVPVLNISNSQVVVKSRWNDGSVKHAIASGKTAVPATIGVLSSSSGPSGTNLTVADIQAANPQALVQLGGLGTVNLSSLLATPFRTWISGPEMVEAHYRSVVGSDPTLQVWFYVQFYKGGRMFIRAVAENGYLDVATSNKNYVPIVTIGGTTVYNNGGASLTHYAHTRWTAEGWIGGDPQITPKHDTAYLISSKLVPNYMQGTPSTSTLSSLYQIYQPMQNGGWTQSMGNTGFQDQIGLLPLWDSLYITSGGDSRAYRSILANAKALNSYGIVWNDSATKLPTTPSGRPAWTIEGANGGGATTYGAGSLVWDVAHHGSGGYLAYLITGDYYYLETMEDQSALCYLINTSSNYYDPANGFGTLRLLKGQARAAAWCMRTVGQLAAIGPSDPIINDYRTLLANNGAYWNTQRQLSGINVIGYLYSPEAGVGSYGTGLASPWMQHFWVQSYGHVSDLEPLSDMSAWNGVRDFLYRSAVGILGPGGTNEYCYTKASNYTIKISDTNTGDPTAWYDSWGQVYQGTHGAPSASCGTALEGTSGGDPSGASMGYWGNLLPAIAYAVDHGALGASVSWNRLMSASNWSTVLNSGFNNIPNWGIMPRPLSSSTPPSSPTPTPPPTGGLSPSPSPSAPTGGGSPSNSGGGGGGTFTLLSPPPAPSSNPTIGTTPGPRLLLTRTLFRGMRGTDITELQSFLIATNYLSSGNNTGYYGNLTRTAVQKYQCVTGITCQGDEASTGYGMVGRRTRAMLNGGIPTTGTPPPAPSSLPPQSQSSGLLQLLQLQQQLLELQKQMEGRR